MAFGNIHQLCLYRVANSVPNGIAMLNEIINLIVAYSKLGIEFIATHLMTIEGIVGLFFGFFLVGLIVQIRK